MSAEAKSGRHTTVFAWERQVHCETGTSYHLTSQRLETSEAVTHHSQWSVDFDPRVQSLRIHTLRIIRSGLPPVDFLQRERMRLIQRESRLENLVIDGVWTLLAVLDDIRPGDVLETAFSLQGGNPVREDACDIFFALPPLMELQRFRFVVHARPDRPHLRWKTSSGLPAPIETRHGDRLCRTWSGAQTSPREPEEALASGVMDYEWVQVSDWPDWETVSRVVAERWERAVGAAPDLALWPALEAVRAGDESSVFSALNLIQREIRYLSVDLDHGGWIPTAPAEVLRRRYGDCKDLSLLASRLLAARGINARPVLVGTGLRGAIRDLLPGTCLFNHAILEFEIGGRARWLDLTTRNQGGDLWSRNVERFDAGLPVSCQGAALASQPGDNGRSAYLLRETFLLDTRRNHPSLIELRLRLEGIQADIIRGQRSMQGPEEFARQRERAAVQRYGGKVRRTGEPVWSDQPRENVCEIVETYEAHELFHARAGDSRAIFATPGSLVWSGFPVPPDTPRRTPWHVNHPLTITHAIVLKSSSMGSDRSKRRSLVAGPVSVSLEESYARGVWKKIHRASSSADRIAPGEVADHRKKLETAYREMCWEIMLPWNTAKPSAPADWGQASESGRPLEELQTPDSSALVATDGDFAKIPPGGSRRRRRVRSHEPIGDGLPAWPFIIGGLLLVKIVLFALSRM